jgi:antirestriction protein ArdC
MSKREDIYTTVTNRIVAELEAGSVPWVQPWSGSAGTAAIGLPQNATTGRSYSGINILLLWGAVASGGYPSQAWLTFKQALELGGHVRKGERGTTVVYASRFIPRDQREHARETGEDPRGVPFLKTYTVFNVAQCEGLPDDAGQAAPAADPDMILPEVDELIRATGADFRIGGDRAFYAVGPDYVQVPPPQAYLQAIDWHRTALHELTHWSGASSRLARDQSGSFGSVRYAQEELVAEMGAAFTCSVLGIRPTVRHADYIASWLSVIREDPRAIFRAASAASKAADFLLDFRTGRAAEADTPAAAA